ncbi:MAG: hypothetical protein HYZ26_09610 [Chloroflexi bacterium]|nr:hypothetical protein [Chloroflexota bacterium]
MAEIGETHRCFNCARSQDELPVIAWTYRGAKLWVCCECMPRLIHKWAEVVQGLSAEKAE